ncbi:MAG TPA: ABC transporter permease [Candidatus Baltobacteraceae bacterium]|nr:ABC transporter permease [Candidatus Baltobacteraceae bacterium]
MAPFLLRRVLYFIPVIFIVTVVVFAITMLLPGDPALAFLGEGGIRDKVAYEAMRLELGLDRPLPVQYAIWLAKAAHGDLGRSVRTHEAVTDALAARLPVTIELAAVALIIALVIAIPVGILSATRPNSPVDTAATVMAVSGVALPEFFVGILLIYLFAVYLRILPPSGYVPLSAGLWPNLRSLLLPALSLGLALNAVTMRQVRASLIEVMREEYVTVARAKGVPEGTVIRSHALKNAMIPVITVIGLQVGRLFGGTVVVETIFAFPGMGRLAADSIFFRDFPALQGVVLVMALAVLVCNLLTDVLYAYVDPRIRFA